MNIEEFNCINNTGSVAYSANASSFLNKYTDNHLGESEITKAEDQIDWSKDGAPMDVKPVNANKNIKSDIFNDVIYEEVSVELKAEDVDTKLQPQET